MFPLVSVRFRKPRTRGPRSLQDIQPGLVLLRVLVPAINLLLTGYPLPGALDVGSVSKRPITLSRLIDRYINPSEIIRHLGWRSR